MRDVAREAGVSLQTVSNYVNGRFNLMSEETRERVGRELDRLGYRPNAAARSLRAKRTTTLGFLVLDEGARFLADPMTDLIIAGIGDVARDNGYSLLIQAARPIPTTSTGCSCRCWRNAWTVLSLPLRNAGRPAPDDPQARRPRLQLCRLRAGAGGSTRRLGDRGEPRGSRRLTEYLLEQGHRRIAFVSTGTPWPMVEERLRGYRALAAADAAAPELEQAEGVWDPADGSRMAGRLLDLPDRPQQSCAGTTCLRSARFRRRGHAGWPCPATSR